MTAPTCKGDALGHVGSTLGGDGIPVVTRSIRPFHGASFGKGQLVLLWLNPETPSALPPAPGSNAGACTASIRACSAVDTGHTLSTAKVNVSPLNLLIRINHTKRHESLQDTVYIRYRLLHLTCKQSQAVSHETTLQARCLRPPRHEPMKPRNPETSVGTCSID
ncbi:hypothetical protein H257_12954 [Aphanomyces astaci]|uniref:Uncharacterized protein n=1 Tax=Aphanomyces astaci TaxID=112090 RepID=W4FW96_APHAT|nr:hypothetical protein H257_12954 [Aphanomyces astaci]ETV71810.1 hypothetical protein H257_12954 [Aphanomyces astaci]|eukprot:XP_009838659.1 hypothetical protein H257_12954 [Aphanomyces astaci]